jgi:chemotaxis methyl-accepting protein methylase
MTNGFVSSAVPTALVSRAKQYLRRLTDPIRYRLRVHFQPRQNHIYTQFCRFPSQCEVLVEDILPRLLAKRGVARDEPLEIAVFACCSGEEAYTLAYVLATRLPGLSFRVRGYDIVPAVIAQAKLGSYTREHVYSGPFVSEAFVTGLFEVRDDTHTVRPQFASLVSFEVGDMTDAAFMDRLPRSDLVFAQNVLFHLPRPVAKRAFENLVSLLGSGGSLFVNGMDTDMRSRLTRHHDLEPVTLRIAEIHEEARVDRGAHWANSYWGREPLKMSGDWVRKYCTIYSKKR